MYITICDIFIYHAFIIFAVLDTCVQLGYCERSCLSILSLPDEGYFRNLACKLNKMSTFLLKNCIAQTGRKTSMKITISFLMLEIDVIPPRKA